MKVVGEPHPKASARSASELRTSQIAFVLSGAVASLMVAASAAGLLVDGLYHEDPWAREALRGGDLVTLVVVAPVLAVSTVLTRRGSTRATAIWLGLLGYGVYNYAYYVFGTDFNDAFLLHIALLSTSMFALLYAVPNVDLERVRQAFGVARRDRWIGLYLVVVGAAQAGLWIVIILRNAITGEVMADIPERGQHLVFALDLVFLMPSLVGAGSLLMRRKPSASFAGAAVASGSTFVLVNLVAAAAFQAAADVQGVEGVSAEGIVLVGTMAVAAALLLHRRPGNDVVDV